MFFENVVVDCRILYTCFSDCYLRRQPGCDDLIDVRFVRFSFVRFHWDVCLPSLRCPSEDRQSWLSVFYWKERGITDKHTWVSPFVRRTCGVIHGTPDAAIFIVLCPDCDFLHVMFRPRIASTLALVKISIILILREETSGKPPEFRHLLTSTMGACMTAHHHLDGSEQSQRNL
jgi:hypothetical protein